MGMVFKNNEYMNGGCFENLSGTSVPKSIGRGPPGVHVNEAYNSYEQRTYGVKKPAG
jgi:hypothetical protein